MPSLFRALCLAAALAPAVLAAPLRVGATLPAYYSWATTLLEGLDAEVVALAPPGADLHGYHPPPAALRAFGRLDLVLGEGRGHDRPLLEALRAARQPPPPVLHLEPAEEADPSWSHTFLSPSGAQPQLFRLARQLGARLPAHRDALRARARAYARRLRQLRARAALRLAPAAPGPVVTVHDGWRPLLTDLGLEVAFVIEPRHGVQASAGELAEAIDRLRAAGVRALLTSAAAPEATARLLRRAAGVRLVTMDHGLRGPWTPGGHLEVLQANLAALVEALAPDDAPPVAGPGP